jgi:hypothetical protein
MNLWMLNKVTGYYKHVRTCSLENAQQWLMMFQTDQPSDTFILSVTKPRGI